MTVYQWLLLKWAWAEQGRLCVGQRAAPAGLAAGSDLTRTACYRWAMRGPRPEASPELPAAGQAALIGRCGECEVIFRPLRRSRVYCSAACRQRAFQRKRSEESIAIRSYP